MSFSSLARWFPALALVALTLPGCEGTLSSGGNGGIDAGRVSLVDGGPRPDAPFPPGTDAAIPPGTDAAIPPGTDSGPPTDASTARDAGPSDPCAGVTCGANAACNPATRMCACNPGFMDMGGTCVAIPTGDPAGRTEAEVCAQWTAGHVEMSARPWTEPAMMCDPGTLDAAAVDDTLRRITMFRWLVGLGPVSADPAQMARDQACALMMYRNRMLNHSPPMSWTCYSAEGAMGAGSSNLALGTRTPGDAVDLYMDDSRVPSLGHRRWVINGPLTRVGIGFAGNAQCLGVFDRSGSSSRMWTAWPNPGPSPVAAAPGELWSFHSNSFGLASATMAVTRVSDGMTMAGSVEHPPNGYGPNTVAFRPSGWRPMAGQTYSVTVSGFSGGPITYQTAFVACP